MSEYKDTYFELILKILNERQGFDFSEYRENTIKRRLGRRLSTIRAGDYCEYADILEHDPEESTRLLRDLTIKVSRFFRNNQVFEILFREIFPDLFASKEENNDGSLRIWCAGCAFGEEVYSVAITLAEYLTKEQKEIIDYNISIFGTDIDDEALDKARRGVYDCESVTETNKRILNEYFLYDNDDCYRIGDFIKGMVNFCNHDITSRNKRSPEVGIVANYDLILCRNLLIYFSVPLQKRAFLNLFNSLNPGGYLVLGKSESIPKSLEDLFTLKHSREKIYQKRDS